MTDELIVFDAAPNKNSGIFWTTVIKIESILALDFKSDARPLTIEEREEQGLSIEEIE